MGNSTKYLAIGLTVSLMVNMFLAGFMVAKVRTPPRGGPPPAAMTPEFNLRAFASQLPLDVRRQLRSELRQLRPQMADAFREVGDAKRAARDIMLATDIDKQALDQALERIVRAEAQLRLASNQVIGNAVAQLPLDRRQKVVEEIERRNRARREQRRRLQPSTDDPF